MTSHIAQAGGNGRIEIGGRRAPAAYRLTARTGDDGSIVVNVEVTLPRDWLLEKDFAAEANLRRENGETVVVKSGSKVTREAPISIQLSGTIRTGGTKEALLRVCPEFSRSDA